MTGRECIPTNFFFSETQYNNSRVGNNNCCSIPRGASLHIRLVVQFLLCLRGNIDRVQENYARDIAYLLIIIFVRVSIFSSIFF